MILRCLRLADEIHAACAVSRKSEAPRGEDRVTSQVRTGLLKRGILP
jgi:hypothetical protein